MTLSAASLRALVASLALASACASSEVAPPPAEGAILEVVNRTSLDLTVAVRGRVEAQLRPGTRVRVRELTPGPAELVARATTGGAGAFEVRHAVELERGRIALWALLPDEAGGPALAEPPPLSAIVVENTTPSHVIVAIDGATVGRVFAGATRTFPDVPTGARALTATPDDGRAAWRHAIELGEAPATWRVETVGAPLEVVNRTDETLDLTIDGHEVGHIRAGATWRGTLTPGTHVAAALSQPSRRPYGRTLTIGEAPVTWEVDAGQAELVVDNQTGEALDVTLPGRDPIAVERGASVTIVDVATGPIQLTAVGRTTRLAYAGRVDLLPGQRATWTPAPILGSLRIVNRTSRELWIYRRDRGATSEVAAGVLAPDGVALIRELARGSHHLAAVDPIGKRRYETTLDLSDMPADTWTIQPATGSLTIENRRDEPVGIFVDARAAGEVPAKARRTIVGLAVGDRLVEALGQRTGYVQRDRAAVSEERVAAITLPDPTAFVVVDNTTGEDLETRGVLADQASTIGRGQSLTVRVKDGGVRLTVVGRDSGLVYQTDMVAKPGAPARWVVRMEPASLTIWNQLGETVAVTLDDKAVGSVASDASLTIGDLAPGRRIVQTVGLRSGSVRSETIMLAPDADERLTLGLELGVLVVENRAAEVVEVSVDGRPYGVVRAGAIHSFDKVLPGRRRVGFDYTKSRRSASTELDVREGQRARVVAEVPLAPVVVTNGARQDVVVRVDGEVVATVGHDAPPALLHIPAGPRLVQIERLADRTIVSYRLDFWADTALHLPVPPRTTRLVVVNRLPYAVEIRRAEHVIGRVEPGASGLFDDLADGEARLFARDPAGAVTHSETRRIEPGETATWVLEVPPTP